MFRFQVVAVKLCHFHKTLQLMTWLSCKDVLDRDCNTLQSVACSVHISLFFLTALSIDINMDKLPRSIECCLGKTNGFSTSIPNISDVYKAYIPWIPIKIPIFFCIVSISLIPCGFQELCYRSILKHRDLHESCIAHALQAKTSPPVAVGNISSFFGPGDPGDQLGRCKRGVT